MDKFIKQIATVARNTNGKRVFIAIDGRCGAGKTTFAKRLAGVLDAPVIPMDDFFLRPEQRTSERLSEAGGNVDRERFLEEVLIPLREAGECSYRPYDCSIGGLSDAVKIPQNRVYIIEGSYSCHPELWEYYDMHIFLTLSLEEQMSRITWREGAEKAEMFRTRWIPMEEKYFDTFDIADKCEFVFDTTIS